MKSLLLIFFSFLLFLGCNQPSSKTEATQVHNHNSGESNDLTLHDGKKWQADSSTNRHLAGLKTMVQSFKVSPFPTADRYQILGSDVESKIQNMVQDCTLKGAPDEALHHWMLPVLHQARELKTINDTTKARPIVDSIDHRINIYYDYFE